MVRASSTHRGRFNRRVNARVLHQQRIVQNRLMRDGYRLIEYSPEPKLEPYEPESVRGKSLGDLCCG